MRIEDTDAARNTASSMQQAAQNLIDIIENTDQYPDLAAYQGETFDFQGYTFDFDPQGWLFNIAGAVEKNTGFRASEDAWGKRRQQYLQENT